MDVMNVILLLLVLVLVDISSISGIDDDGYYGYDSIDDNNSMIQ